MARVIIIAEPPDWHARRLAQALRGRGLDVLAQSLRRFAFVLEGPGPGIAIAGLEGAMPDAVLVKTIARGSFEQITLRLGFLHAMARLGIPVINPAVAIERCVDKSMTSFLLHRAGIPTPATVVGEGPEEIARWRTASADEWVQKPLFGSQGRGLSRLAPGAPPRDDETYAGVYYLQRFIGRDSSWRDFRVMVVGGRAIAAMTRHGKSWITNVRQGGRCEAVAISPRLAELSIAAAEAVGTEYAGVDLIEDPAGSLQVLEVNSMPAWKGLQSVAACDIAKAIADHVIDRLG